MSCSAVWLNTSFTLHCTHNFTAKNSFKAISLFFLSLERNIEETSSFKWIASFDSSLKWIISEQRSDCMALFLQHSISMLLFVTVFSLLIKNKCFIVELIVFIVNLSVWFEWYCHKLFFCDKYWFDLQFFPIANTLKWHAQHNYLNWHTESKTSSQVSKSLNTFSAIHTFCISKWHFLNTLNTVLCITHNNLK